MRIITVLLIIIFSFSACKSNVEIIGNATNAKDGASIRTSNGVYIIEDLYSWHDSINNKKVKAIVNIKNTSKISKSDLYDSIHKTYRQGRLGTTITAKLKSIEIIKQNK